MHRFSALLPVAVALLVARDTAAHDRAASSSCVTTPLGAAARGARLDSWAVTLPAIAVKNTATQQTARLRLYSATGAVNDAVRLAFEGIATQTDEHHALSERLEQLVFKAAYHFGGARVDIVSAWREQAGRHTSGDALDFKLQGVYPQALASYLRGLSRVGVGIYTNPKTQFVHLDVRDQSFHWVDASPPGVKWRERQLRDPHAAQRDASWAPEADLPL